MTKVQKLKNLRDISGATLYECKKYLEKNNYNVEQAYRHMKKDFFNESRKKVYL